MNGTAASPSVTPAAETTVESILQIAWPLPLWLVMLLLLGLGGMSWWLYRAERGRGGRLARGCLAGLRFSLLALVLWMLSGWSWLRFQSDQPELIVVIDRSASMNTRDVAGADASALKSRLERAVELLQDQRGRQLEQLNRDYQVQWFTLAETLDQLTATAGEAQMLSSLVAEGAQSRLGEGLVRLLQRQAGKGTAAVIFLSDGINTSGTALADAAKAARRSAVPVYTVAVGRQTELPDVRLADLLIERSVYLGDQVTAEVNLVVSDVPNAETRIAVRDMASDKVLDETRVMISPQQRQVTARLSFVPDKAGELALRLEATPIEGEQVLDNNALEAMVDVQDKTLRVLLIAAIPSYEFRFLKSFLERARQVDADSRATFEVDTVLQDADPMYVAQDQSALRLVPSQLEAIEAYDAFVFMDVNPELISLTAQQAIVEAVVRRGAGCLFVSGSDAPARALDGWPLAKLLPVERQTGAALANDARPPWGQLRWQPTALGSNALPMQLASSLQESFAIWQKLPDFAGLALVEQVRSGAQVLSQAVDRASGQAAPLLITQFAGAGRSALQATDETYRWTSFLGTDLYYQRYWGQLLRWLSRGKLSGQGEQLELLVDPKQANVGQPIRFQVTLSGELMQAAESSGVEVAIEGSSSQDTTLRLLPIGQAGSSYQATVSDLKPGSYRAVLLRPASQQPPAEEFSVTAPPGEQASLRADLQALRQLAEQSRGRFFLEAEAKDLFQELPAGKPTRLGQLPSEPMWNAWWVGLLFVALITGEWLLRRRFQML